MNVEPVTAAALRMQISDASTRLAALRAERRPHALRAAKGDAAAKQALVENSAAQADLRQRLEDLTAAAEEASATEQAAAVADLAAARQARLDRAREIGAQYLAEADNIDHLLASLVASVERYRSLGRDLLACNCLPDQATFSIADPARMAIAWRFHGAHSLYMENQYASRNGATLESIDRATVAKLQLPPETR